MPLLREGGGVEGFSPEFSYQRFIPADGCAGPISDLEADYVQRLIEDAERHGHIPVLTSTRSLGRVRGLKAGFPGLHVLLYRDLYQQWCSYMEQAFQKNKYFLYRMRDVVRLNQHDLFLKRISELFPVEAASPTDVNTFYQFIFLHLHIYSWAAGAVDLIADLNRLAGDTAYRQQVEHEFASQDLRISLADARSSITYSMLDVGSQAVFEQNIQVIGEMIADNAPDDQGRAFVQQAINDLLRQQRFHEFQSKSIRTLVLGPGGLLSERDGLRSERDHLMDARDLLLEESRQLEAKCASLQASYDALVLEQKLSLAERDSVSADRDRLLAAQEAGLAARAVLCAEHDSVAADRDRLQAGQDAAMAEQGALRAERDGLAADCDRLRAAQDAALAEQGTLRAERDSLAADLDRVRGTLGVLKAERDVLRSAHDTLIAEKARLQAAHHAALADGTRLRDEAAELKAWAERDGVAVLNSISWRLTRPLRRLGIDRPDRPQRPECLAR